jgi:signal transduction histidine kinase
MIKIVEISLENEMDLILAHKRCRKVAEKLGLTIATQTTFVTAVSEIVRMVIEYTDKGKLEIGLEQNDLRHSLKALVSYNSDVKLNSKDDGFYYAQKLVPEFEVTEQDGKSQIEIKIGLPRSLQLNPLKIQILAEFFLSEPPINPYEQIKIRNLTLHKIAGEQEEELRRSKIIDEKKNEFISIASHELKTPITIIKAYTQLVKASEGQCSDRIKGFLDKIDHQTTKLVSLVQQLLDVSKIENGSIVYSMENTGLNSFIKEVVSVMKNILPHHEVIINLPTEVNVKIDKLRMEQVFSNLIGNAAKYSGKNTRIKIDTLLEGQFIKIAINDQGIGMSKDSIKSIFDKFYRDKDVVTTHSGLGMGLYIASKIINDHGGNIWVESESGTGSTFFFTIPCC